MQNNFHLLENLQARLLFSNMELDGLSKPPRGNGLVLNFGDPTVVSHQPLCTKKYLKNWLILKKGSRRE